MMAMFVGRAYQEAYTMARGVRMTGKSDRVWRINHSSPKMFIRNFKNPAHFELGGILPPYTGFAWAHIRSTECRVSISKQPHP